MATLHLHFIPFLRFRSDAVGRDLWVAALGRWLSANLCQCPGNTKNVEPRQILYAKMCVDIQKVRRHVVVDIFPTTRAIALCQTVELY